MTTESKITLTLLALGVVAAFGVWLFLRAPASGSETTTPTVKTTSTLSPIQATIPATVQVQPTEIQSTATVQPPSPTIVANTSTPRVPTLTPFMLTVPGNDGEGVSWFAPSDGKYTVQYGSGAYSLWANDSSCPTPGCWKTTLLIFKDCTVRWIRKEGADLDEPGDSDFPQIGLDPSQATVAIAEALAKSTDPQKIELKAGDCLKFIAIDGKSATSSAYPDNRGEVILIISALSP